MFEEFLLFSSCKSTHRCLRMQTPVPHTTQIAYGSRHPLCILGNIRLGYCFYALPWSVEPVQFCIFPSHFAHSFVHKGIALQVGSRYSSQLCATFLVFQITKLFFKYARAWVMVYPMKPAFAHCVHMNRRMCRTRNLLAALGLKRFDPCLGFSGT
jgi:hypothetical protein